MTGRFSVLDRLLYRLFHVDDPSSEELKVMTRVFVEFVGLAGDTEDDSES